MKKLIGLLLIIISLVSCSPDLIEVENKEKYTSVEILNNVTDTVGLCEINGRISLIDLDSKLVKYNFNTDSSSIGGNYIVVNIWIFVALCLLLWLGWFLFLFSI